MWSASDEALVAGLSAGDSEVALAIVRDRQEAEEVAQDTFVRAWRYAASYDPRRGPVAAWLLTIARNAALDCVRAKGRRREQLTFEPFEMIGEPVGDDGATSPHEDFSTVVDALRSLPTEQRDALMAASYYGLTAREISEAWGVPVGTIKTRLRLAVHKLRDDLTGARL